MRARVAGGRRLLAALCVVGAGAIGTAAAMHARAVHVAPLAAPLQVAWAAGRAHTYALDWETTSESRAPGADRAPQGFRTDVALRGELLVKSYGLVDGAFVLAVSFSKLEKASVRALERDLLPTHEIAERTLLGQEAVIELEPSGALKTIRFADAATPLFRHLMRAVVEESAADLGGSAGGADWMSGSDGPSGHAIVRLHRKTGERVVVRERASYDSLAALPFGASPDAKQTLTSHGAITLDESGAIGAVVDEEALRIEGASTASPDLTAHTRFSLKKLAEAPFAAGEPPVALKSAPAVRAEGARSAGDDRAFLERRAAGVTMEGVAADLRIHGALPRMGDGRWAWAASAFLELQPSRCAELAALVVNNQLDLNGTALALDLLATVGHREAQAALREALHAARDHEEHAVLLQRIGFLKEPDAQTVAFVEKEYAGAKASHDDAVADAAAVTLGMLAARVSGKDRARARGIAELLTMDLYASKRTATRAALLFGLGNAGMSEDEATIAALAFDRDAEVRAAAAKAMRKLGGDGVRAALAQLVGDADAFVQRAAIGSLMRQKLAERDLFEIERTVAEDRLAHTNDDLLADLLADNRGPVADAVLTHMMENDAVYAQTRARIARIVAKD